MQHTHNLLGQPIGFPLPNWKPPELPSREPMEGRLCRLEPLDPNLHSSSLHEANTLDAEGKIGNWLY